jgi:3-deoxy-D-manno-octulosonate 8-phosphate phosphatase (KDO 8-P phosphatase)
MTWPDDERLGTEGGRRLPPRALLHDIELLLLDVDGVLTDGRIHFDRDGQEYKSFHVHDSAGIVYWHRCGRKSGFLSGRGGDVVMRRAQELAVQEIHLGKIDKARVLDEILQRCNLRQEQVAYVGDDLLDLPVLMRVGFAATVPECRAEVREHVHFVTRRSAGFGAVRDVIEFLLQAQDAWAGIVARRGLP